MKCKYCSSWFDGFCIEEMNEVPGEREDCDKFIDREIAESMCDIMCPTGEEE